MADYRLLPPFILPAEGGLSDNATDAGGWTNKGITYVQWVAVFGDNAKERFKAMISADWMQVYKPYYWDKCKADLINDQKISNFIVDWVFNAGPFYPEKHTEHILNEIMPDRHLDEDGQFGTLSLKAINEADQDLLYKDLIQDRLNYYANLCAKDLAAIKAANPGVVDESVLIALAYKAKMKMLPNLTGWRNRVNELVKYNAKFV